MWYFCPCTQSYFNKSEICRHVYSSYHDLFCLGLHWTKCVTWLSYFFKQRSRECNMASGMSFHCIFFLSINLRLKQYFILDKTKQNIKFVTDCMSMKICRDVQVHKTQSKAKPSIGLFTKAISQKPFK